MIYFSLVQGVFRHSLELLILWAVVHCITCGMMCAADSRDSPHKVSPSADDSQEKLALFNSIDRFARHRPLVRHESQWKKVLCYFIVLYDIFLVPSLLVAFSAIECAMNDASLSGLFKTHGHVTPSLRHFVICV